MKAMNNSSAIADHRFAVAPMQDWTDRHCRYLLRLISRHARLYTGMITIGALLKSNAEKLLEYGETEHPVGLQPGGSGPRDLAACARLGSDHGYDEINLNPVIPFIGKVTDYAVNRQHPDDQ